VNSTSINVLLVEDHLPDVRLLQEALAEAQAVTFDLVHVEQLSQALHRLREEPIDVILVDLGLTDSQGLDTFNTLHSQVPDVPVVIMTGLDDEKLAIQAVQAGAQDYLVKGQVVAPLLERALRYAIERCRLVQALEEAKQREQREEELRALTQLSNASTTHVTGLLYGLSPLRESMPELFRQVTRDYSALLDQAWKRRIYQVKPDISETLRSLVDQIGVVRGGPRDVVELHTQALEGKIRGVPHTKAQVYVEEGRMMILELMGHLASFYRTHSIGYREVLPDDSPRQQP
jgi:DNA-binding NarL/FixJ family response regulator